MLKAVILLAFCLGATGQNYQPTWESLDSRPNPQWWNDAKFGIFMHWGLYSVPAYGEWYWNYLMVNGSDTQKFHDKVYGANFKYQDFAPMWKAEVFDAQQWAALFKASGARWVTMTSKHHEGVALWHSRQAWNWNTVDNEPHRDLLQELSSAVRAAGIKWGIYYSLFEWFHPDYIGPNPEVYVNNTMLPQMYDIATTYQPDIFYVDGEWDHDSDFWQTRPFLAWLFNESPNKQNVVINDRWGNECRGVHGGYFVCENGGDSPFCPPKNRSGHPWANHMEIGSTFGYNRMLSLSLIGLSPLSTGHPIAFQR
eukprot:TRINITY_DN237_c0_g1_i2.p1 TRINITY_DN237_c0_g1~~TRINITY_DN237_c0_g1_i2.p1  ORF type:complete len:310 (-),score=77.07 TRINITY_DN237_c0_g1_i2:70-999(-)